MMNTSNVASSGSLNAFQAVVKTIGAVDSNHTGFCQKTVHFGQRFFAGAVGVSMPLAIYAASNYYNKTTPTPHVIEAIVVTGVSLISAAASSNSRKSFFAGAWLGSVAWAASALARSDVRNLIPQRSLGAAVPIASDLVAVRPKQSEMISGVSNTLSSPSGMLNRMRAKVPSYTTVAETASVAAAVISNGVNTAKDVIYSGFQMTRSFTSETVNQAWANAPSYAAVAEKASVAAVALSNGVCVANDVILRGIQNASSFTSEKLNQAWAKAPSASTVEQIASYVADAVSSKVSSDWDWDFPNQPDMSSSEGLNVVSTGAPLAANVEQKGSEGVVQDNGPLAISKAALEEPKTSKVLTSDDVFLDTSEKKKTSDTPAMDDVSLVANVEKKTGIMDAMSNKLDVAAQETSVAVAAESKKIAKIMVKEIDHEINPYLDFVCFSGRFSQPIDPYIFRDRKSGVLKPAFAISKQL